MPEEYTKETIVVHADMGAVVKLGEKVQLEGKLLVGEPQPNLPSFCNRSLKSCDLLSLLQHLLTTVVSISEQKRVQR